MPAVGFKVKREHQQECVAAHTIDWFDKYLKREMSQAGSGWLIRRVGSLASDRRGLEIAQISYPRSGRENIRALLEKVLLTRAHLTIYVRGNGNDLCEPGFFFRDDRRTLVALAFNDSGRALMAMA